MRTVIVALALVLAGAGSAAAGWVDGNELNRSCGSDNYFGKGFCAGFATAIAEIQNKQHVGGWHACIPEGVEIGQLESVTVKSLHDHPQDLHYNAVSLVARALAEAFPCPEWPISGADDAARPRGHG